MSKQLLVVPPGTLSLEQHRQAVLAGFWVLECEDPKRVRLISPEPCFQPNDVLMSALAAMQGSQSVAERAKFTAIFYERLKQREEESKTHALASAAAGEGGAA